MAPGRSDAHSASAAAPATSAATPASCWPQRGHDIVIADNFVNSSPQVLQRLQRIDRRAGRVAARSTCATARAVSALFAGERFDAVRAFRRAEVGRRILRAAARLLRQQHRRHHPLLQAHAARPACAGWCSAPRRPSTATPTSVPVREDAPLQRHQSLWPHQAGDGAADRRPVRAPIRRSARPCLRYFNPVGAHASGLIGEDPRRHAQQPDAVHLPGGGRAARAAARVRRRLADGRRHRRARLHPRHGPGARACRCARVPGRARIAASPSTWAPAAASACWNWCARSSARRAAAVPYEIVDAARGRRRRGLRRSGAGAAAARLARRIRRRCHVPRCVALAVDESAGLRRDCDGRRNRGSFHRLNRAATASGAFIQA